VSYDAAFLDDLRARLPLSGVIGRSLAWDRHKTNAKRGDYWACCPFHGEKTPSFHVDDGRGRYYCFGCHAGGDIFTWAMARGNSSFREAVAEFAREAGLSLPEESPQAREREAKRQSLRGVLTAAAEIFRANLASPEGELARSYLAGRGIDDVIINRFGLGLALARRSALYDALTRRGFGEDQIIEAGLAFDPVGSNPPADRFRDRVIFPITDARAQVVGFGGRSLTAEEGVPKYLNSPATPLFDKSRLLYNAQVARDAARAEGRLVISEGYVDVIAWARAGVAAAVAPLGTAITPEQLDLAWRMAEEPVVCLDGDAAGQTAAARLVELALPLLKPGRSLRFVTLPDGLDPDDLLRERGADALRAVLDSPQPLADRLWQMLIAGAELDTPERRAKFQAEVVRLAGTIADPTLRQHYEADLTARVKALWKDKGLKPIGPAFSKPEARTDTGKSAAGGFGDSDITEMNKHYAVVIIGQRAAILQDNPADTGAAVERVRFMNVDAFGLWLRNRRMPFRGRWGSVADHWLESPGRRQYHGLEFTPAPPGVDETRTGFFNLWRGFEVEAKADVALAQPWLDHVFENVSGGRQNYFDWVVSWFAWMVQRPRQRLGTSLVLRGGQGAGKTITGKIVGSLFPANYFLIDEPRYLVGQFNAHLASCLLLQADEGFWAGDKQAEGRIKGLVTSEFQMIEYKGVDPVRLPNYLSLMISSNEEWVVPAGLRERRFAVLDVAAAKLQDHGYFGKLAELYRRPEAKAALLHTLATWKIDESLVRKVPSTEALWSQKLRSLDSFMGWLLDLLVEGGLHPGSDWPDFVETQDLHKHFLSRCEKLGLRHPLSSESFGRRLRSILPDTRRAQRNGRRWCYLLPPLDTARQAFCAEVDYPIDWAGDGAFYPPERDWLDDPVHP